LMSWLKARATFLAAKKLPRRPIDQLKSSIITVAVWLVCRV